MSAQNKLSSYGWNFKKAVKDSKDKIVGPVINLFAKLGFKANHLSTLSLIFGLGSAAVLYLQQPRWVFIVFLVIGQLFDNLDGGMARKNGPTKWGFMVDITFDRLVMCALLGVLAYFNTFFLSLLLLYVAVNLVYVLWSYVSHGPYKIWFFDGLIIVLFLFNYTRFYLIFLVIFLGFLVNFFSNLAWEIKKRKNRKAA